MKIIKTIICIAAVFLFVVLSAQTIEVDKSVARVKLIKVEVISQRQFKEKIDYLEGFLKKQVPVEKRKELLDSLIDEMLIIQAAERDNVRVSDSELQKNIDEYKQQIGAQLGLGRAVTDDEVKTLLEKQGISFEIFKEEIHKKAVVQKYIMFKKASYFNNIPEPKEEEVVDFYESNRSKFISPEMVKFKQIVIITRGMEAADKTKAKNKINAIYNELKNGSSFDKYMDVFLEGGTTKVGGISYETWAREDEFTKNAYGKDFFSAIFKLKEGERSAVLESNVGYHIIEIIEKMPYQVLSLDDKIPQYNNITVKQYIVQYLKNMKQVELFQKATEEVRKELRQQADVKIYEENLIW